MEKLKKALAILSECYEFFTPEKANAYFLFLKDLPDDAVAAAIGDLIRTEEKLPSIAKIRSRTEALIGTTKGIEEVDVGQKWNRFINACKNAGYFDKAVHFPDDIVLETVAEMFPLEEMRRVTLEKLPIIRAQFIARYKETMGHAEQRRRDVLIIQRIPGLAMIGQMPTDKKLLR